MPKSADVPEDSAELIGGDLVFFSNVSRDNKQAVLDSLLLAELAADKACPQGLTDNTVDWYNEYCDVMRYVGWVQKFFEFSEVKIQGENFSISDKFLEMLADLIGAAHLKDGQKILDGVQKMLGSLESSQSDYSTIFSHFHGKARKNAFGIGLVTEEPSEDPELRVPSLYMFAFEINASFTELKVLWFNYQSSQANLKAAHNLEVLNKKVFKLVKETIEEILGDQLNKCIRSIPI